MFWASAASRLSQGEPICDSHESKLLERMAVGIADLPSRVRECFLDLGAFPEDKKIPLDVLINIWVEIHDIEEKEAFAILYELAEKNLVTLVNDSRYLKCRTQKVIVLQSIVCLGLLNFLVKQSQSKCLYFDRAGDGYNSYFEISAYQHDVLRDLTLYTGNRGAVNGRRRLLMPRRETRLPKEWERNMDRPFHAQIVSIHTGIEINWTEPSCAFCSRDPFRYSVLLNCVRTSQCR